jgi:tetratricopeptide (TPR) repeat protein
MLSKNKNILFLLLTLFSLPQLLKAQSLRGKRIYVSPSQEVMIKFPSEITDFDIQNKKYTTNFQIRTKNRKHLYINSNVPAFKSTSLVVKERWNTHIFILQYKETLDGVAETVYDYSKPKVLAEEAARIKATAVKLPARSSSNPKPALASVTDPTPAAGKTGGKVLAEDYTELEMKANVAFTIGKFEEAKDLYQKALKLQPDAQWPSWQLSKIEVKKLTDAARQYQTICEFCYTKYKTTGDSAFNKKAYSVAKSAYTQALGYKNTDRYVASQIVKIEKLEKDAEAKKGLAEVDSKTAERLEAVNKNLKQLSEYKDTISVADHLFKAASYDAAKRAYEKAEELKPGESYPGNKIAEIDSIMLVRKQMQDRLRMDSANMVLYATTIRTADKAFESGDFKKAKSLYQSAQRLRTEDKYASERISGIDVMLLEEEQRKKATATKDLKKEAEGSRYSDLVKEGNAAFTAKEYEKAREYFLEALAIKPSETLPRTQIHLINRKLEEQRNEERYKYFIRLADSTAFKARHPLHALPYYDSAHTLKPREEYAKKQIISINEQLARSNARALKPEQQRKLTEKFNEAFKVYRKADEARIERKYPEAYTGFSTFLNTVDTANASRYLLSELYYINQAKDYIQQLEDYKPQAVGTTKETPQEDMRRRRKIKNDR